MITIDISVLITLVFGVFAFFAYIANVLVKGVSCLTELKKDVASIKENQAQIIKDIEKIEDKVFE